MVLGSMPAGSGVVFDYALPRASLNWFGRMAFDAIARRVAKAGEPFQLFLEPAELMNDLRRFGFNKIEDWDKDKLNDASEQLPSVVVDLMRDIEIPNGIGAVGYTEADIPDLVPGTMKQQRLLATCPRPVDEEDIAGIFARSIENW